MGFLRRKRDADPEPTDAEDTDLEETPDEPDATESGADESDDDVAVNDDAVNDDDVDEETDDDEDVDDVEVDGDDDDVEVDEAEVEAELAKKRKGRGLMGWLRAREKETDYGPDFAVRVATLPDLEHFPEDGHVHPEIVRTWMALQQFGEAMLLVSWYQQRPAGYVMVSWTGDWDDKIRKQYKDVPSITNLWVDDEYADHDVERKLLQAALVVVQKQGRSKALISVDREDKPARRLYRDLGFTDTKHRTTDAYVYRDADGKKRRGVHKNLILVIDFDAKDDDADEDEDTTTTSVEAEETSADDAGDNAGDDKAE